MDTAHTPFNMGPGSSRATSLWLGALEGQQVQNCSALSPNFLAAILKLVIGLKTPCSLDKCIQRPNPAPENKKLRAFSVPPARGPRTGMVCPAGTFLVPNHIMEAPLTPCPFICLLLPLR